MKCIRVDFSQDHIRRVAMALRENWTTDVYVLARIAAEALIRDERDLIALLPPTPKPRVRKAAPELQAQT